MKIYSGIPDKDGNIPWIDNETGEEGTEENGPRTITLAYNRTRKQFAALRGGTEAEIAALLTGE